MAESDEKRPPNTKRSLLREKTAARRPQHRHTVTPSYDWPEDLPPQTFLQQMIHADHQTERATIIRALLDQTDAHAHKITNAMLTCAVTATLAENLPTGKVIPNWFRCRQRICPLCATARSRQLTERFATLLATMKQPRTLVLTIKHDRPDLASGIADLKNWFRKLRKQKVWTNNVKYGAYSLEIKLSERSKTWHPHIHAVFEGYFVPWQQLRGVWHEITGGSEIVWLKPVADKEGMARELAKYVSKPYDMTTLTAEQIREFASATRGLRMFNAFGKLPQPIPDASDKDDPWEPEAYCWTLPRLIHQANIGCHEALDLLGPVAQRWPLLGRYIYAALGDGLEIPAPLRNPLSGKLRPLTDSDVQRLDLAIAQAYTALRDRHQAGLLDEGVTDGHR